MNTPTPQPQWADLARAVDEGGGVFTTTMKALRTMAGALRTNQELADQISEELARRGFGHRPDKLPVRQESEVMIYRLGSMGAEVFNVLEDGIRNGSDFRTLATAIEMINRANEKAGEERLDALKAMSYTQTTQGRRKRRLHGKPTD